MTTPLPKRPTTAIQWLADAHARLQGKAPASARQMLKDEAKYLAQAWMRNGHADVLTRWVQAWHDLEPWRRTRPLEAVMEHLVASGWRVAIESPTKMAVVLQQPIFRLGQPTDLAHRTGQLLAQAASTQTSRDDLLVALAPWVTPAAAVVAYRWLDTGSGDDLVEFEAALPRLARHVPSDRPLAGWWTLAVLRRHVALREDLEPLLDRAWLHLTADLDAVVAVLAQQRRASIRQSDPQRFDAVCDRLLTQAPVAVQNRWMARDAQAFPQTLAAQRQAHLAHTPAAPVPAHRARRRV